MAHHHSFSPRLSPALASTSSLHDMARNRKLRLLVAATGPRDTSWAQALVVRLSKNPQIEARAIVDDVVPRLTQTIIVMQNRGLAMGAGDRADDIEFYRQQAFELVEWADLMVCVPLDADSIAKMLAGVTDTFLGEVLRGWDTQKSIVLVPGMSTHMWSNPMTKKHMSKLHRKWNWIRVVTPILWHYEGSPNPKRVPNWNGFNEVLGIIKNQADLLGLGRDVEVATAMAITDNADVTIQSKLPPEIWTIILDYAGDWELAKALGMYTNLPMPSPWTSQPRDRNDPLKVYEHELEWTVLTCNSAAICKKISQSPPEFNDISALVIKLVIKFGLIDVLAYMEANRPDLFKAFDGTTAPGSETVMYMTQKLSMVPPSLGMFAFLDWWWRRSGLMMRYTESALEQASGNGHLLVLEWWRDAAAQDDKVVLRPGRSLLWATQHGQADVLRWWDASGIPAAHGDSVAKMASRWGQVEVLETWRRLKGDDKLVFDAEVLVSPTIFKHLAVLEWWRNFAHGELEGMEGRKQMVEFRTCNIEEALEDSIGDQSAVRRWWTQNGLNLGLRDEEWLKTRYL
ncbi:related to SIS2 protein (cycle-specific gene control) [Fusarium fujikuroi IMI 58289]|uniref:Related to SIS2 protein (Cycle-specific gene control) n=1 Tax=Gibberella fujikuroi (strain CBS 195.34 / IMI 58289 / NRRL A-6831) TaxID=1279085 RepID=S0DUQ4_GIBF5|nr:SIS2-like protein [Fusarium fujikuroi IMI 58289]CCT65112.1 related to SIS2 protein (cycle-specific gene control) [Fusarium fujikuroi IMI 58289]